MSRNRASAKTLNDELRAVFRAAADVLIPRYRQMPAASEIGIEGAILDKVLVVRPDISDDFMRAVQRLAEAANLVEAMNDLSADDEAAFGALTLAATGGYYTCKEVWDLIGYPGQEYLPVEPEPTPEYLSNRMLERVARRGPIYRSP